MQKSGKEEQVPQVNGFYFLIRSKLFKRKNPHTIVEHIYTPKLESKRKIVKHFISTFKIETDNGRSLTQ